MVEFVRLYLGMDGNLSEKTTQLSSFWFTTLLIELPVSSDRVVVMAAGGSTQLVLVSLSLSLSLSFVS